MQNLGHFCNFLEHHFFMMRFRPVILAFMRGIQKVFVPIHIYDYCFRCDCFPNHVIYHSTLHQPSAVRFPQERSLFQGA
jgi:hypothetical protein